MLAFHFVLLSSLAVVFGTVVNFDTCDDASNEICPVSNVQITPCTNGDKCILKKRRRHTISFDFVPTFSAQKLKTGVYWANGVTDVPFNELSDADGCQYTTCPTEPGKSQNLSYSLKLGKLLPSGKFTIKWKVSNEENDTQLCCFKANIEIR